MARYPGKSYGTQNACTGLLQAQRVQEVEVEVSGF